jgi:hypothetical protein
MREVALNQYDTLTTHAESELTSMTTVCCSDWDPSPLYKKIHPLVLLPGFQKGRDIKAS